MTDPYAILGIARDAGHEAVRAAYRRRMREVHPDLSGSHESAAQVNAAYVAVLEALGPQDTQRGGATGLTVRHPAETVRTTAMPRPPSARPRPPIGIVVILFVLLNAVLLFGLWFNLSGARW